jgi:uroporphyrin-III C-methyltransferase
LKEVKSAKTAFLSLLIAVVVAGFSVYQFDRMRKWQRASESSLAEEKNAHDKTKSELTDIKKTLEDFKQEISALAKQNAADWPKEEAEYLLKLASIRLAFTRDIETTLQLLKAADDKLQSIGDPMLTPLREAIAKDEMALKAVKQPDIEGLWLKIGALISEVPNLPTRGAIFAKTKKTLDTTQNAESGSREAEGSTESAKTETSTSETSKSENDNSWRQGLSNSWHEVKDLIKIQRHTKPIEPLLPEEEQLLAKEHLRFLLEQIRWALLERNTAIYHSAIQDTIQWTESYFENSNESVQNLERQLKDMAKIDIKPNLPSLQSLTRLQNMQNTTQNSMQTTKVHADQHKDKRGE